MLSRKRLYTKVVQWTARNITQQYQVYILAVGVGLASGLAAVILKNTVHYTHYLLSDGFNYEEKNYLYFISTLLGILLTALFVNSLRHFKKQQLSQASSHLQ
jgi:CIC family chloride channel protein